mmetsp:Transcript_11710/g.11225  ORF Transcript_11710/g.11225 Transcript_11710/m.11225 type:complete len:92 (+) Transcript_11710:105-380(+)
MDSLIQTLTDNAKYMPHGDDNNSSTSPCEVKCVGEQEMVISCVNSIREASEISGNSSNHENTINNKKTHSCLPDVVLAWTRCCSEANKDEL